MLQILLVSARPEGIEEFTESLSSDPEVRLERATSGAGALAVLQTESPNLVIVDSGLPDTEPLDLVRKIIGFNAMVNTAVVSALPDADFHERSEGLGVLCRIPMEPGVKDSESLLRDLRRVLGAAG